LNFGEGILWLKFLRARRVFWLVSEEEGGLLATVSDRGAFLLEFHRGHLFKILVEGHLSNIMDRGSSD
jgi:hypothetical protein